ncbi:DUF1294 domain-containing protein [Thiolapillus sp.]
MQLEGQKLEGRLVRWNDDKAFGFIRVTGMKKDVFIHISALRNMPRLPQVGDSIQFVLRRDEQGRLGAAQAVIHGLTSVASRYKAPAARRRSYKIASRPLGMFDWFTLLLVFSLSVWVLFRDHNPMPMLVYLFMSLFTFTAYAMDKKKAIDGQWRISENVLHMLELLGGWPGGLVAQRKARHKSGKKSYQAVFWLIVFLHLLIWVDYLLFSGHWIWQPLHALMTAF